MAGLYAIVEYRSFIERTTGFCGGALRDDSSFIIILREVIQVNENVNLNSGTYFFEVALFGDDHKHTNRENNII